MKTRINDKFCEPCAVNGQQSLATHMVLGEPYCQDCFEQYEVGPCEGCGELVPYEDCEDVEGVPLCWSCRNP